MDTENLLRLINKGDTKAIKLVVKKATVPGGGNFRVDHSLLKTALTLGKHDIAALLIPHVTNLNKEMNDLGYTALHYAVVQNQMDLLHLLIGYGANPDVTDNQKSTPLHFAVIDKNEVAIDALLAHGASASRHISLATRRTPFQLACEINCLPVITLFAKYGCNINEVFSDDNIEGRLFIPLQMAIRRRNQGVVSMLIEHKADVNLRNEEDETSLHLACHTNDPMMVDLVMRGYCPDVDAVNRGGMAPIHIAIHNGNIQIVMMLLRNGANHRRVFHSLNPMEMAVHLREDDIFKCLLRHNLHASNRFTGAELSNMVAREGDPLLHYAAKRGDVEMATLLIVNGVDVQRLNPREKMATFYAIKRQDYTMLELFLRLGPDNYPMLIQSALELHQTGALPLVKYLLEHGVDPNRTSGLICCATGLHGLGIVKIADDLEIADLLLRHGANVNAKVSSCATPLHYATVTNNVPLMQKLLQAGAKIHARDEYQRTPLHLAAAAACVEAVELLLYSGANVNVVDHFKLTPVTMTRCDMRSFTVEYRRDTGYEENKIAVDNILWKHVVMLRTAGLFLLKKIDKFVDDDMEEFTAECKQELEKIKAREIADGVNLMDVLRRDLNKVIPHAPKIYEGWSNGTPLKIMFPLYGSLITLAEQFVVREYAKRYPEQAANTLPGYKLEDNSFDEVVDLMWVPKDFKDA